MKQNNFLIILLTAITLCSCSNNNSNISSNNSQNISDKYTIYFDTDGGSPINIITQDYGTIVELPTPTKDGYKFVGWIHNNKFISEKFILLKSDIKLTAYWVDENLKFTINEGFETLTITGYLDKTTTSIIIPNRSTVIEGRAFHDCTSLASITIPSSVTKIGENAFVACESLENVYYEGTIEDWCNIGFSNDCPNEYSNPMYYASHLYMLNSNNEYEEVTSIEIPSKVTSIGNHQFYKFDNATSISISNSIITIGEFAFSNCTSLTSITIPSSVTIIEKSAFENCTSLENLYYEGTIEDWCNIKFSNYLSTPMYYANHFYMLNSNNEYEEVTSIEIPNTVTSIGFLQFAGFNNVTSITIPSSVTTIGIGAFEGCTSLTSVTIPSSVTKIEKSAFEGCTSLTTITIPNSVTEIEGFIFTYCDSLTIYCEATSKPAGWHHYWNSYRPVYYGITKDNKIEKDGIIYVIENNEAIVTKYVGNDTSLTIPTTIELDGKTYNVTVIGGSAFSNCTSLISITIPSSVTTMGIGAFSGCTSLTNITIPNSITTIEKYAFYNCTSLASITIPSSVTTIGEYAFSNCTSLISITIPSSVTTMGIGAFSGCTSLTNITIPNSIETIEKRTFSGCTSLTSIIIPSSVRIIGESAFKNCTSLTSIIIPSSVIYIRRYAFLDCTSLTIYCEAAAYTSSHWDYRWNPSNCTVVWDYKNK